jgi:hypothetical protein
MKNVIHYAAKIAEQFGFLDKVAYRNICIKLEFDELINTIPGVQERIEFLQNKYYLGYERIKEIVYPRGENKELLQQITSSSTTIIIQKQRRTEPRRK